MVPARQSKGPNSQRRRCTSPTKNFNWLGHEGIMDNCTPQLAQGTIQHKSNQEQISKRHAIHTAREIHTTAAAATSTSSPECKGVAASCSATSALGRHSPPTPDGGARKTAGKQARNKQASNIHAGQTHNGKQTTTTTDRTRKCRKETDYKANA